MEFLLLLFGYIKNMFLFAGKRLLLVPMGWLTKILKGSSHKYSDGQANRRYNREDRSLLDTPRYSAVKWRVIFSSSSMFFVHSKECWFWVQEGSDFDKEEIECAIALSLSEQEHVIPQDDKGKKVIGKVIIYPLIVLCANVTFAKLIVFF